MGHTSSPTRGESLVRGWIVAVSATTLAAASHGLAGGHLPHPLLWGLCTALAALVCVGVAGRKFSRLSLLTSVAFSQGLFHTLFSAQGTGRFSFDLQGQHHAGSLTLTPQLHTGLEAHQNSHLMIALHLGAALTTYAIVRQGEKLSLRVIEVLRLALQHIFSLPSLPVSRPHLRTPAENRRPYPYFSLDLLRVHPLRGPPAVFLAQP